MHIEKLWSFNKNNKKDFEAGKQLNLDFVDMEKDKDGKTVYDFLEEAGIKEGDEDYKKILNYLSFKDGNFYVGNQLAKLYFHWRKVYSKDKEIAQTDVIKKQTEKKPTNEPKEKKVVQKETEESLSKDKKREGRKKKFLYGQWD